MDWHFVRTFDSIWDSFIVWRIGMARRQGSKNQHNQVKEERKRRASELCLAIESGMARRSRKHPVAEVMEALFNRNGEAARKQWYRWLHGKSEISDEDYRQAVKAAKAHGWLDEASSIEVAEAAASSIQTLQSKKAQMDELKRFNRAKRSLLASLEMYAEVCHSLKLSEPIDRGDADLQWLLLDADDFASSQRERLHELEREQVFAALPSPDQLIAQLRRQELKFDDAPRARQERRAPSEADTIPDEPEEVVTESSQAFAELAKQSKARQQARFKRLEALARAAQR